MLRDWVGYAGRRQGVPAAALREAVAAVEHDRNEMLDTVGDPGTSRPAKAFAVAAPDAGVDMTDPDDPQRFLQRYDESLAAERTGAILAVGRHDCARTVAPSYRFHQVLGAAMGWQDFHRHVFERGTDRYGHSDPDLDIQDERKMRLADVR